MERLTEKNIEKGLLQQITYLSRLIEQKTNAFSNSHRTNPHCSTNVSVEDFKRCNLLKNNYKFLSSGTRRYQSKLPPSSSSATVPQLCNESKLSFAKLKLLNKKVNANKSCSETKSTTSNKQSDNPTEEISGTVNVAVKKSIHMNRKKIIETLKLCNDKSNKNCVHLNPAKFQVKCGKCEVGSTVFVNDKLNLKNVIHINPNFNKNLSKKVEIEQVVNTKDSSQCIYASDEGGSPLICGNTSMNIHFNKKFIANDIKKQDKNEIAKSTFDTTSLLIRATGTVKVQGSDRRILAEFSDKPGVHSCTISDNVMNLKSENKVLPRFSMASIEYNSPLSKSNRNITDKSVSSTAVCRSENSTELLKPKKSVLKDQNTLMNSLVQNLSTTICPVQENNLTPVRKYKNRNKIININRNSTTLHRKVNNHMINKSLCLKKSTNSCNKNVKMLNRSKQLSQRLPVLKKSNSNGKLSKLIKLSKTKMIRGKCDSLVGVTDFQSKTNKTSLSSKKSKSVWLAPNKTIELQSENKKAKILVQNYNKLPSPYKYNSESKAVSNKLKYIKVNTPLKSTAKKVATSSKVFKNQSNLNLNKTKEKSPGIILNRKLYENSKLVSISRTKLIRKLNNSKTTNESSRIPEKICLLPNRIHSNNTIFKFQTHTKLTPTLRMARSVKTKYKLIRNFHRSKFSWNSESRRTPKGNVSLKNKINKGVLRDSSRVRRKSLTIGGIKYLTTKTKLRRKFPVRGKHYEGKICKKNGESYRISVCGRSLKRINSSEFRRKQINLACKSSSMYHFSALQRPDSAYNRVIRAKQKSIALLTRKLKKCNEPCLIFNRFGRCSGHERGICIKLHDKKRVAICKKFLRGSCENKKCLLSHDVGPSKMPTCRHFLAGVCVREDCPYLHVKVNNSAPICMAFLQGYCPDAGKCKKRHIASCPEFEVKGICSKGKSCPYPHPKLKSSPKISCPSNIVDNSNKKVTNELHCREFKPEEFDESDSKQRRYYFVPESDLSKVTPRKIENKYGDPREVEDHVDWLSKRPRIGDLPGFIPLDIDSSSS